MKEAENNATAETVSILPKPVDPAKIVTIAVRLCGRGGNGE